MSHGEEEPEHLPEPAQPPAPISSKSEPALPPHPLDSEWYMRVEDTEYGPFSGHKMKEFVSDGRLTQSTEVKRRHGVSWIVAKTDATLKDLFADHHQPQTMVTAPIPSTAQTGNNSPVIQIHNNIGSTAPRSTVILDPGADKSPGLALFLSLFIVGLGQIYNGEVLKGVLMFFGCILLWIVMLGWIINIWSIIDAYQRAKELRTKYLISLGSSF